MPSSSSSGKRRAQADIIDVDEYSKKFEPSSDDVVTMDAKEFRKSVRRFKKEADHPSVIGDAIRQARAALHSAPPAAKRQKVDHLPSIPRDRILAEHRATRSPSVSSSSGHAQAIKAIKRPMTLEISDSDDEGIQSLLQEPRPKKPRTQAPRPSQVARPPQAVQIPDVIELFSDGSDVDMEFVEDESDWDPPGWDVNDDNRWIPMPVNPDRIDVLTANLQTMTLNPSRAPINSSRPVDNTTRFRPKPILHTRQRQTPQYVWEMFPATWQPRSRPRFMELPTQPIIRTQNEEYEPLLSSRCINKLKQSPGGIADHLCPINNVQQKGQWTIVTSGCIGGEPDTDDEDHSPYNHCGSLITYDTQSKTPEIPIGHVGEYKRKSDPGTAWTKHYAVHDAQFDPFSELFVSSGADRKVLFWAIHQGEDDDAESEAESGVFGTNQVTSWRSKHAFTFRHPPNQLCFKPAQFSIDNLSILAIAERRIGIYSLTDSDKPRKEVDFRLFTKKNEPHVVGSMVWGTGPTDNHLFASSEPDPLIPRDEILQALFTGRHKAFDVEKETALYDFEAEEAGDSLCINSSGSTIALATIAENYGILRLFDVARQDKRPTATINVDPYPSSKDRGFEKYEGEVTSTAFSPDDVYLALGRNDNTIHVYDTRYLQSGPLYRLEHHGECRSAGKEKYGIAKVEWLHSEQTRRIALATAGEDGCVRLWNPLKAMDEENGQVIAQVNSDIGYFSVGDPYRGESRLVVGDLSGQVSFFDLEV